MPKLCFGGTPKFVENPLPPLPTPPQGCLRTSGEAKSAIWGATGAFPRASFLENQARGSENAIQILGNTHATWILENHKEPRRKCHPNPRQYTCHRACRAMRELSKAFAWVFENQDGPRKVFSLGKMKPKSQWGGFRGLLGADFCSCSTIIG